MHKVVFALTAALGALVAPAHATLQVGVDVNGVTFFCADNTACDTNPTTGILQVADGSLNGVEVNGSIQASDARSLSSSSLSVINTGLLSKTVTVAISATDFVGGTGHVSFSGSGTWQGPLGETIGLKWFDDPTNVQGGATGFDTPGLLVGSFGNTSILNPDSFAFTDSAIASNPGLFSLTEQAAFTLKGGAELVSRGQSIEAVPEPSTWAMLALGVGFLALAGRKRGVRLFPRAMQGNRA